MLSTSHPDSDLAKHGRRSHWNLQTEWIAPPETTSSSYCQQILLQVCVSTIELQSNDRNAHYIEEHNYQIQGLQQTHGKLLYAFSAVDGFQRHACPTGKDWPVASSGATLTCYVLRRGLFEGRLKGGILKIIPCLILDHWSITKSQALLVLTEPVSTADLQ